jgi:hypothetical protein
MRRKQNGQVIRIGDRWYVRYWERRNVNGAIERKRVTHLLGPVTTRGKRPPADVVTEAERHMVTVNSGALIAERIVTIGGRMTDKPKVSQSKPTSHQKSRVGKKREKPG